MKLRRNLLIGCINQDFRISTTLYIRIHKVISAEEYMKKIYMGLQVTSIISGIIIGYYFGNITLLMYIGMTVLIHGLLKLLFKNYMSIVEGDSYKIFKVKFKRDNPLLDYINKEVIIGALVYIYALNTELYRKYSLYSYVAIGILMLLSFKIYHIYESYIIKKSSSYISYLARMTVGITLWLITLLGLGFIYSLKFFI